MKFVAGQEKVKVPEDAKVSADVGIGPRDDGTGFGIKVALKIHIPGMDKAEAVRRFGIGYVSEDRKGEGLILQHTVAGNIAATVWHRIRRWLGFVSERMQAATAEPFVRGLDIRTPSLAQRVGNLSGGNQQKVSVAKWLAANSRILFVDEPTVGIDIKSKTYLHELILRLARGGAAVVVISSDMPELVALADRIAVMNGFRIVATFSNTRNYADASQRIMQAIHG